mmetsp:Transcript_40934/g.81410  ORF Transcript_40934/g.81410 Transcript_40934/m.81410 type:complete len:231 (+) Transcript_40934:61-753(+)
MSLAVSAIRVAFMATFSAMVACSAVAENVDERTNPALPERGGILDELEQVIGSGRRSAVEESHGWFVDGLKPRGESWNASSPSTFFAAHADGTTEGVFERRLGSHGLSLHEPAVFAATLEDMVHEETVNRLHSAYEISGLAANENGANDTELDRVLDTYMLMLVKNLPTSMTPAEIFEEERIYGSNPEWNRTITRACSLRREVESSMAAFSSNFSILTRAVEAIADRWNS